MKHSRKGAVTIVSLTSKSGPYWTFKPGQSELAKPHLQAGEETIASTLIPVGIPTYHKLLDSLILAPLQWPRNNRNSKMEAPFLQLHKQSCYLQAKNLVRCGSFCARPAICQVSRKEGCCGKQYQAPMLMSLAWCQPSGTLQSLLGQSVSQPSACIYCICASTPLPDAARFATPFLSQPLACDI